MQVVWFKRDLRVQDHSVLMQSSRVGPVLPLYVVETELWQQADASGRHWAFVAETLSGLRQDLGALGQPLIIRTGQIRSVPSLLKTQGLLKALWPQEKDTRNPEPAITSPLN